MKWIEFFFETILPWLLITLITSALFYGIYEGNLFLQDLLKEYHHHITIVII